MEDGERERDQPDRCGILQPGGSDREYGDPELDGTEQIREQVRGGRNAMLTADGMRPGATISATPAAAVTIPCAMNRILIGPAIRRSCHQDEDAVPPRAGFDGPSQVAGIGRSRLQNSPPVDSATACSRLESSTVVTSQSGPTTKS
jgi:hypothetical protein